MPGFNTSSSVYVDVVLLFQELVALGEAVGTESRGLTADTIASLPSVSYKAQITEEGSNEQWVNTLLHLFDKFYIARNLIIYPFPDVSFAALTMMMGRP